MKPKMAAETKAATKAPTIPPQKRSGTNTVKCHTAIPIITQTSRLIAASPSPVLLALLAPALLALLGALGGARACAARGRWRALRAVGPVTVAVAGRGRRGLWPWAATRARGHASGPAARLRSHGGSGLGRLCCLGRLRFQGHARPIADRARGE